MCLIWFPTSSNVCSFYFSYRKVWGCIMYVQHLTVWIGGLSNPNLIIITSQHPSHQYLFYFFFETQPFIMLALGTSSLFNFYSWIVVVVVVISIRHPDKYTCPGRPKFDFSRMFYLCSIPVIVLLVINTSLFQFKFCWIHLLYLY